jgi:hypothetical protein
LFLQAVLCSKQKNMKTKIIRAAAVAFLAVSALSILWVSFMAFANPQQVMDLVGVTLPNTDAYSSIRGVYGGVGLSLVAVLVYISRNNLSSGLFFLSFFWAMYAVSRLITIASEGQLGSFGNRWLVTELVFAMLALTLGIAHYKNRQRKLPAGL